MMAEGEAERAQTLPHPPCVILNLVQDPLALRSPNVARAFHRLCSWMLNQVQHDELMGG